VRSAAVFIVLCSCSGELRGLTEGPLEPVAVIRGHVGLDLRNRLNTSDAPKFRAGILWANPPVIDPFCAARGPNPLDPNRPKPYGVARQCADPLWLAPGEMSPSVEIDPTSDEILVPLARLPPIDVMFGPVGARVAYGSLLVFSDDNDNGDFDVFHECTTRKPNGREHDSIYASSFSGLDEPHQRVTFVEGEFDRTSLFYPHPNCGVIPKRGFSIWNVGSLLEPGATCTRTSTAEPIELVPAKFVDYILGCQTLQEDIFPREPPEDAPLDVNPQVAECIGPGVIADVYPTCACRGIRTYALSGCKGQFTCEKPQWDYRAQPPVWWPEDCR